MKHVILSAITMPYPEIKPLQHIGGEFSIVKWTTKAWLLADYQNKSRRNGRLETCQLADGKPLNKLMVMMLYDAIILHTGISF